MKKISFTVLALGCLFSAFSQTRATFEDLHLAPNSYYDGSDLSGGFLSGDAYFYNLYDTTYQYWASGFVYSNVKNDTTAGYINEYASAPAGGALGSSNYAIGYTGGGTINVSLKGFATGHKVYGFYAANSTYAYLSMKNGDQFAKKFGGPTGTDPDWFKLTIRGWYNGNITADSVDFYLADFRSADSTQDYILKSWKYVDLQGLGNVDSLFFELSSSDVGSFGMNTPAYFCLDNLMTSDGAAIVNGPVTVADTASTIYTDSVIINILANDIVNPFLGHTLTLTSGPQVSGAVAYIDSNDRLVYVPLIGIRTVDTLAYTYCDELDSCSTAQVVITINSLVNTGIGESTEASFMLYPNPSASHFTLSSIALIQSVAIIDMSGRVVDARAIGQHSAVVDVASLSAGVYTVQVYTFAGTVTKLLIKE